MHVHFIAIGGSVMHNLAIALRERGYSVSGSDDEIFDPAKTTLDDKGLLPSKFGWFPEKITKDLDAVILGMHARVDNPELLKAQKLKIPIYSFPAYLYEQAREKQRITIAGSHGKTSITAMILHVVQLMHKPVDYMIGARLKGLELQVKISDADTMLFEGDEYLSSPLDKRPKFMHYKSHMVLISGIAWDHINVFPTFREYERQFEQLVSSMEKGGTLILNKEDERVMSLSIRSDLRVITYKTPNYRITSAGYEICYEDVWYAMHIIGRHNMQNLAGAREVCKLLGVDGQSFMQHISTFEGAAGRLQVLLDSPDLIVYKDFAHAPSKVEATVAAAREAHPDRKLKAVLELHTFSSLNRDFLPQFAHVLDQADEAVVYFNPHTLSMKGLQLTKSDITKAFMRDHLLVIDDPLSLKMYLGQHKQEKECLLMMSSGNFGGLNLSSLIDELT